MRTSYEGKINALNSYIWRQNDDTYAHHVRPLECDALVIYIGLSALPQIKWSRFE